MFGVMAPGKLGGGMELKTAEEIFSTDVIEPYQMIVTEALYSIFNAAGAPATITLYKPEAEEANVEVSYTGIQISSAVDIISKVGTGELTGPQAVQLLVAMLGFDRTTAEGLFADVVATAPEEATELSEEKLDLSGSCDYLIEMGEEMDDEWELIDARRVDYDEEEKMDALWSFARVPSGKPQAKSEQDNELIKVRYAYMPKVTGKNGNESRDFCKRMVNAGERVWRKEDIEAASGRATNPGWGPNGADTYDLWLYKGGGSCQHFWERRTYLRKNNKKVSANRARKILREAGLEPLPKNDPRVAKRPRDMQNRGFLEPKNWTTPK